MVGVRQRAYLQRMGIDVWVRRTGGATVEDAAIPAQPVAQPAAKPAQSESSRTVAMPSQSDGTACVIDYRLLTIVVSLAEGQAKLTDQQRRFCDEVCRAVTGSAYSARLTVGGGERVSNVDRAATTVCFGETAAKLLDASLQPGLQTLGSETIVVTHGVDEVMQSSDGKRGLWKLIVEAGVQ